MLAIKASLYLIAVNPAYGLAAFVEDGLLVLGRNLVLEFVVLNGRLHPKGVTLERILCHKTISLLVVLVFVFLCVFHHSLDFLFAQTT